MFIGSSVRLGVGRGPHVGPRRRFGTHSAAGSVSRWVGGKRDGLHTCGSKILRARERRGRGRVGRRSGCARRGRRVREAGTLAALLGGDLASPPACRRVLAGSRKEWRGRLSSGLVATTGARSSPPAVGRGVPFPLLPILKSQMVVSSVPIHLPPSSRASPIALVAVL